MQTYESLTMKHLRYFEALGPAWPFRPRCRGCAISQPALSLQMKELEDILSTPLVERGRRQISLTSLGEDLRRPRQRYPARRRRTGALGKARRRAR